MNDDRLNELLRESWRPQAPKGMRERVLRRAAAELPTPNRRHWWVPGLRAALVAAVLAVAMLCHVSDLSRQSRMADITGVSTLEVGAVSSPAPGQLYLASAWTDVSLLNGGIRND